MTVFDAGYMLHKAKRAEWKTGLREDFEYRDVEPGEATGCACHAQIIRAKRALCGDFRDLLLMTAGCCEPGGGFAVPRWTRISAAK
jgi:hypothetical protein